MYIQDKDEAKVLLDSLQDCLDDVLTWDANHEDVLNYELNAIQAKLSEAKDKLKTL